LFDIKKNQYDNKLICILRFISIYYENNCVHIELVHDVVNLQYFWTMVCTNHMNNHKIKYRNDLLTYIVLKIMCNNKRVDYKSVETGSSSESFENYDLINEIIIKFIEDTGFNIVNYNAGGTNEKRLDKLTANEALLYALFIDENEWSDKPIKNDDNSDSDDLSTHYWKHVKFGHKNYGADYIVRYASGSHLKVLDSDFGAMTRASVDRFITGCD
jgi:hypothetical protein